MAGKNDLNQHLYALVICGGGGTRLWPRSREKTPKQFSRLFGKETLYQKTIRRLKGLVKPEKIFIVTTSKEYAKEIKRETPQIPQENIFWEPARKNTAMACSLGTLIIHQKDPQAVIMNFWADHLVRKEEIFKKVELAGAKAAFKENTLVTIGIKPTYPHTGFGYIKAGKQKGKIDGFAVYHLEKFVEKPDFETAQRFIKEGNYYWNSGMYIWPSGFFLETLKKYTPAIYQAVEKIRPVIGKKRFFSLLKEVYEEAPEMPVDVAVSEKIRNGLVIPADIGWNDVGDWSVIYEISPKDDQGNVIIKFGKKGEVIALEAKNNLIQFDDQLIALIGVEDLIVVDSSDAVLICRKDKAQEVKQIVNLLKEKNKKEYL
ncbi:MAG: mannose-1-phosphate guanylyltransferase [Microgenomates group bacterium]